MEKLCMVKSFMFLLTPCMNFSALFKFSLINKPWKTFDTWESAEKNYTPNHFRMIWYHHLSEFVWKEAQDAERARDGRKGGGGKTWRGIIFVKIHSDTKHTHTNQKTQAKYKNASRDHNHLRLDKTALMICGWIYCKQTLLIRFLQYCLRFQWKIVLLQTLSSL